MAMDRVLRSAMFSAFVWLSVLLGGAYASPDAGVGKALAGEDAKPAQAADYTALVPPPLPDLSAVSTPSVAIIKIHGTIDMGLAPHVERALAAHPDATVIVLDVDTFGGRVDSAVRIRDAVLSSPIPVIAFVNRRAISAGALISLAADHIVFTSGASMGAATPIQVEGGKAKAVGEKMVSYMRAEMRSTAEANGRDGLLAEAMVDASIVVPGVSAKDKLLTLSTQRALAVGLATAQHETLDELIAAMGLKGAKRLQTKVNWAENIARFLTDPTVSGLLMSLGMLGLFLEFYTPGFGFAGGTGLLCLLLFFFGHMIVDLAGLGDLLIFGAGLLALGLEVFVIPGFGVAGVLGIALLLFSMVNAMSGMPIDEAWRSGSINLALSTVMISLAVSIAGMVILIRVLPRGAIGRKLVLQTTLKASVSDAQPLGGAHPEGLDLLVGKSGVVETDLRLAGKVLIEGQRVDVVSQTEFLDRGTPIRVLEVEGSVVVVVRDV